MAIIRCPECEENISSTVQQCVHCGAKIRFCPECESVFAGDIANCPNCGYVFEKVIKTTPFESSRIIENSNSNDLSQDSVSSLKKLWHEEKPMTKLLDKVTVWGCNIIELVLGICAILILKKWSESGVLVMALGLPEVLNKIGLILIGLMIIMIIHSGVDRILETWSFYDFSLWLKQKKITFDHILKKSFNEDMHGKTEQEKEKKEKDQVFVFRAKMYAENLSHRNRVNAYQFVRFAFSAIADILWCMWAKINLNVVLVYFVQKTSWEQEEHFAPSTFEGLKFSAFENNWMIVAFGVLLVLRIILTFKDVFDEQKILKEASKQYKDSSDEI